MLHSVTWYFWKRKKEMSKNQVKTILYASVEGCPWDINSTVKICVGGKAENSPSLLAGE